ncbi:protein of unknown function [Methylocaldum szegediense]|uniref:Uncharacterized protein n=1 Tax=Methylocaldum szegediense TaxID=73780 RepID=A0ABN8X453_9GAMM|nr:protein of unknown function [Methylocaldum szegediense]
MEAEPPAGARAGARAAAQLHGYAFIAPASAGDTLDQCAIRVPADSYLPWYGPCGRTSRVQTCSRHICL